MRGGSINFQNFHSLQKNFIIVIIAVESLKSLEFHLNAIIIEFINFKIVRLNFQVKNLKYYFLYFLHF